VKVNNQPDFNDLAPYYNRIGLIRETARQIEKDLMLQDNSISINGDMESAYFEIFCKTKVIVGEMLDNDYKKLLSLMYRVDVSENRFNMAFKESVGKVAASLTELIIERELKKVLIRNYFR